MAKRLTIQGDVNIELMQEKRNKRPSWKHKYVMNRNNSLESVKRVYIYLNGNTKGFYTFAEKLKRKYPGAMNKIGDNKKMTQWFFDTDHLWDEFISDPKMKKIITAMRIDSYEELDARSYIY
ncbi:hypothetical protein J9303_00980 [Bacillaceae bacterium Marseille-Q3522]|nr:hypothetical protein [Bacillaceae bacterium Marseille-Q3522]